MPSQPTATSFALLGLLAIKPWTAYELVAQIKRGPYLFWPRSDAHLYAELKRIVERGHADTEQVAGRTRQATRYSIAQKGQAALEDWLSTEPAAPIIEVEGILRLFFGDQGTAADLKQSLAATARDARAVHAQGRHIIEDYLKTGGPVPERLHLVEPMMTFLETFYRSLIEWCEQTSAEVDTWPTTRDVGLTASGRKRLQDLLNALDP